MKVFFYCPWGNKVEWLKTVRRKFKKTKIYTLEDKPNLAKMEIAIIWDLPEEIMKKMKNIRLIFSLGAGVDHIMKLSSYKGQPIIRLKDPIMAERMSNHILLQILSYQLNTKDYQKAQKNKIWLNEIEPLLNNKITVAIIGVGFLGEYLGKNLNLLGYKVIGFKKSKPTKKYPFKVYYTKKNFDKYVIKSDIVVSILPYTKETKNFIDKKFLNKMKKNALFCNVGRGSSVDQKALISHLKMNKNFSASLDVFVKEPLSKSNILWKMPNVTITPHIASVTSIDSAITYIYNKYRFYLINNKIKGDVDIKKGY